MSLLGMRPYPWKNRFDFATQEILTTRAAVL
jgi:hypothetical protein